MIWFPCAASIRINRFWPAHWTMAVSAFSQVKRLDTFCSMAETLLEGSYQLFDLVTELECEESVKSFQYKNQNLFTLKQTDGSQLAAGCENGTVIVWHENGSSSLENNQQHDNFIECLTWNRHSGGDHLFAG